MTLCNFFRVIAGRDTKSLNWPILPNGTTRFDQNLPLLLRFERSVSVVSPFKDMIVGKDYFKKKVKSIEKSLTQNKSYANFNRNVETKKFLLQHNSRGVGGTSWLPQILKKYLKLHHVYALFVSRFSFIYTRGPFY